MYERALVVVLAGLLPGCSLYFAPSPQGGDDITDAASPIPSGCDRGYRAVIDTPSEGAQLTNPVHLAYRFVPGDIPDEVVEVQDDTGRFWSSFNYGVDGVDDTIDTTLEPGLHYTFRLSWSCPISDGGYYDATLATRGFYVDGVVDAGIYPDAAR